MTTSPIDLFASFVQLRRDGQLRAEPRTFDRDRSDWQVMTFHVDTDADVHADHWEIHADSDELVCCLAGGLRLYLRPERQPGALEDASEGAEQRASEGASDSAEEEIVVSAGTAALVPRGRWHRIELDAPSDIMSVAVPRGTRLEKRADASRVADA
jgi:hypothetical protein